MTGLSTLSSLTRKRDLPFTIILASRWFHETCQVHFHSTSIHSPFLYIYIILHVQIPRSLPHSPLSLTIYRLFDKLDYFPIANRNLRETKDESSFDPNSNRRANFKMNKFLFVFKFFTTNFNNYNYQL